MSQLIDEFIRDVTKIGSLSKSEVRIRLTELLEGIIPNDWPPKESIHDEVKCNCNLCWGYNKCREHVKDNIKKILL